MTDVPALRTIVAEAERRNLYPALARLRMQIFRGWPYLYDGDVRYEEAYLAEYFSHPGAVLIAAELNGRLVGAATASPMPGQAETILQPWIEAGRDPHSCFYFGESVLLPEFRGLGLGHGFFDAREEAARDAGATTACFCAAVRPDSHPQKPEKPRDLHGFWRGRGYRPVEGLVTQMRWRDVGEAAETDHLMQFWEKDGL